MSRGMFLVIMAAFAALILLAMWWGWRRRNRRDRDALVARSAPVGELIAAFHRVSYVSTTRAGAPLERLAIRGLQYKGFADLDVHRDGVAITVTGEQPVHVPAESIIGSALASGRIGKAVERDGLSLLLWSASGIDGELESSFRFTDPDEQRRFSRAIDAIVSARPQSFPQRTTQEDAR